MAFLNTAGIGACKLLNENYSIISNEYESFKTNYLYNSDRDELDEDDSSSWGLWLKGNRESMDAAKGLEEYKGLNWEEHTIEPVRKRSNWYGLTINDTDIWEGLLLGSRSKPPMYPFESTILGTTYFPETMELLGSYTKNIIMSASVAVFPRNSIIPRHNGYETITRIHLPLYVPDGDIGFCVGEETRSWEVGQCLAFNDIDDHNAWNNTDEDRVVLIVDIRKRS